MSTGHVPDIAARLAAMDAAEAEAREVAAEDPGGSLIAFAAALRELASCAYSVACGEPGVAAEFHLESALASGDAFPAGTSESQAFGVLLDYATFVMRERAS
jgi:hypothetical protein